MNIGDIITLAVQRVPVNGDTGCGTVKPSTKKVEIVSEGKAWDNGERVGVDYIVKIAKGKCATLQTEDGVAYRMWNSNAAWEIA